MTQPTSTPTVPPGDPAPTPAPPAPAPPGPTPAPGDPAPPADDRPLGPAGENALRQEREARRALEREMAALAPLKKLAEAVGAGTPAAGGKSDVELLQERFAEHERTVAEERSARWRAEVAHEKGLTPQQAARLQGSSREELAADADALVALFPAPAAPRAPAPDPSQGPRGTSLPTDLDSKTAEAQKSGDWRTAAALQKSKLANLTR